MSELPKPRESKSVFRNPRLLILSLLLITSAILTGCAKGEGRLISCEDWMGPVKGDMKACSETRGQDPNVIILPTPTPTPFFFPDISTLKGVGTALDGDEKCSYEVKPGDTLTSIFIDTFGEKPPIGFRTDQIIKALSADGGIIFSYNGTNTEKTLGLEGESDIKAFDRYERYCPVDPDKLN
ncbi:hypothetical protein KBD45_00840 [Candidatus Dojkabacteria bacterium]|nr:hypothetical protein [Candidatus Dojkabacteria bacterium]